MKIKRCSNMAREKNHTRRNELTCDVTFTSTRLFLSVTNSTDVCLISQTFMYFTQSYYFCQLLVKLYPGDLIDIYYKP